MTANWATLDQWGFAAARYLLEALWQSTLVFAAVAALSAVLRRYTPRARRALWLVALLIAPALPLLSTLAKPAGLPQQSVAAFPVYAPPPVTFELEPEPTVTPTIELPVATVAPPAPTPLDYPWALGLFAYTLGAAFFLAWTLLGHFRIHQWMRSGRAVSDPLLVEPFHRAAARLNVRGPVRVVLTDRVPAPITAGIVRPTVLLPNTITDALTPDDLYAVALHETVHIQQHEPLILTLASLVRSVLYFHPLVWLACRRLAVLAEHTADDAVLEITGAPTAYAKLLTTFAERLPLRTPAAEGAAGLVFCKSAFLKRVEAILGDRNRVRKLTRIALACTVAAVLVSLAGALALPLGSRTNEGVSAPLELAVDKILPKQEPTTPVPTDSPDFTMQTRSGLQIELVGISTHPSKNDSWWKPNGERLKTAPETTGGGSVTVEKNQKALEFVVTVKGPIGQQFSGQIRFDTPEGYSCAGVGGGGVRPDGVWVERGVAAFPTDLARCHVRCRVASGEWKTLFKMDQPADGAAQWGSASTSTTEGEIRFDEPVQVDGKTRVVAAHTIRNSDFRIAALDTSGKEIPLSSEGVFGGSPKLGMLSNTFAAPLTNIKTILFQARILEWVTFKDVPLAPSSAASKSEANKIPLTQSPDTISPGGPAKVESFLRAALEASQGMLKKKVTVSWPDTTLSAAIDTLAKEADFNIVVDSREGKNNAPVQAASFDYQPLVSVLVALLRPTKLEFTVQPGYIWLSSPLLIRKETYGELETRHYSIPAPTQEGLQKLLELLDKSAPAVTDPNTGSRLSYVQILDEDSGIITAYNTPENLDALEKLLPAPTDQESMTKADTSQSSAGFIALPPSNPSSIKVTGCVTDTQGNPLENVTVTALRSSGSTAFGIGKAVTNASGRYALNLPDGNSGAGGWPAFPVAVAFVPSRDGWFEARRWEQGSPYGATERPKPDNEWNVAPAKVLTPREAPYAIDFVMESGAVISGRIREPDGSPYTQDLTLTWERQPSRWDAFVTIDPDEAGRFRCTAPVGNVWLTRGPDTSYGPVALRAPGNYKADLTLDEGAHPSKLTGDIAPDTVEAALTGLSSELAPRISRDDASGFELHVTDGTHPAAGAHVVLAKPGWELRFEEGEFKEAYDHNKLGNAPSVKTGADGKCILPAMEGPFMLAVVHPAGYAICGCDEALAKGTLVLTPWAILQGTLRLSDVLCPDMKLQIQSSLEFDCIGKPLIRPASNAADAIAVNFHALARTDAAARFESKHLPAGHATLSPAFPTGEKDGLAPVVGLQGSVALESGKTTKYDFGESRSTVTGKFDPSQTPMDWSAVKATLRLEAPHIGLDGDNILWKSQGDFAKSPMGKLYNRPITIYSDGTFCLDEVPEGRYQLIAFGPSGSNYASSKFSLPPTGAKPETTGPLSINLTGPSAPRLFPEFSFQAKEVTNPGGATQLKGDVKCTFGETSVTADQAEFGKSMRKFTFTGAVTLTTKAPDGKTLTTHSDHCEIDSDYKAHFTGNVSLDSEKGKGETKSLTLDLRTGEFQMDGPSAGAAQIESNAPAASAPEGAQSTIEQALAKTVSLKMEHIHLTEVAEFLTRQLGVKIVVDSAVVAPPGAPKEGSPITRYVSDGAVSYIDLKDVTLKEALKALTRPMRLGFTVSGDTITITTPSQTADRYKNALDKRVTVSWPDTTLGEAIDAIVKSSAVSIVLDNQSADPKTQVKAASHDSQTLKSVLDPLVQPLNLEYALRKDFIWISTPQRIATDPFGKSSLSAAQDPEFFVSTEIKVIEARHTFGSDALHDLKPLANARRIEGDAMVFTGPEIHIGSLMYPVERERLFDWIAPDAPPFPTGAEAGNAGNASQVKFELISAPRITTAPFHAGDSYKAKVLLNDRIGAPSSGRVAKLANVWNESTYSRYFLSKDFTHDFLNPIPESSPSQIRPKPAVILDFWTKVITSRGADGRETSVPASKDPNYGVAIGESTTVLTDTGELRTDLIFRMRDDTAFDYRGVRIADAKPGIEETSFRYEFQCKPDEVIGFALPYRNRGHLFVIVTFDYPMAGAAFRPA